MIKAYWLVAEISESIVIRRWVGAQWEETVVVM